MKSTRSPTLIALLLLLLFPTLTAALESDKERPIFIEADSVDIDDSKGVSIYKGRVALTQGSMHMTADKITVTQRQKGSDHILAEGNPVTFRQQPDGDKELVKGHSQRAKYDTDSDILLLIDKALLSQGEDTFKSDRITYNRTKAVVKAGASAQGKKRVRVTIQSKKK